MSYGGPSLSLCQSPLHPVRTVEWGKSRGGMGMLRSWHDRSACTHLCPLPRKPQGFSGRGPAFVGTHWRRDGVGSSPEGPG